MKRLSERLRALRRGSGLSRRVVARRVGLPARHLAAWERGRDLPTAETLNVLADIYGVTLSDIVPERQSNGVRVGPHRLEVGGLQRPLGGDLDPEKVLEKYLDAIYELRGKRPGDDLALRDADLAELADALGDTPEEIENRLIELIACTRAEAAALRRALLRRRIAVPAAGLVLGLGGLTPALGSASTDTDSSPPTEPVSSVEETVDTPGTDPADVPAAPPVTEAPPPDTSEDVPPPHDDWAEIIDPQVVERDEDWAELGPAQVVEREDAGEDWAELGPAQVIERDDAGDTGGTTEAG